MELMELLKIEEGRVYDLVEKEIEKNCPEEIKFIEEAPGKVYDVTWSLIPCAIEKGFELGFEMGQRMAGRANPVPVRWSEEL